MEQKLISIGEFAKLGCVTQRTLHHYQTKGLLEPACIDEQSGYRYYTVDQTRDLQTIKLLSTLGLTLDEIASLFTHPDPEEITERISAGLAEIDRRQQELALARYIGNELLDSYRFLAQPIVYDRFQIEHFDRRIVRAFNVAAMEVEPRLSRAERWALLESKIEQSLVAEGLAVLCRNIGGTISATSLAEGRLEFERIFFYISEDIKVPPSERLTIPAGDFITIYQQHYQTSDAFHLQEMERFSAMEDMARKQGYTIAGDYYCEALISAPQMGYRGYDCLSRLSAPVRAIS